MGRGIASPTRDLAGTAADADERRELLRIDDRLLLEYWLPGEAPEGGLTASPESANDAITAFVGKPTADLAARWQADAGAESLQDSVLLPWLMKVDWTLELLLKALARMSPQHVLLPRLTDVNVSGGGVCFDMARRVEAGSVLELRLVLPPFVPIRTSSEVVRVAPSRQGARKIDGSYATAVRFTTITADDRERLIRHILRAQADRLRARHMSGVYARSH